jgi:large subunit ribosomal protein L6
MSRIGKQPIEVPSGVTVNIDGRKVSVDGPKGNLSHTFPEGVAIAKDGNTVTVTRASNIKQHRAFHGMTRALLANMVKGVKEPFSKIIEIYGTGYSCQVQGDSMDLDIGFSHKVKVKIPAGIEVKSDGRNPVVVTISGADKQSVGQLAAVVRAKRPPSPYGDNKGVRYRGEQIRKKAGKAFGDKK